jgi:rhodanese-related sulfurtransferase
MTLEISPTELKQRLDLGTEGKIPLVDCREVWENAAASIAGAELIPMNTIPQHLQRIEDLADEATVVVYCHHGVRSLMVINWLREQGVQSCLSLAGGIDRWSLEVDSSVPRY